MHARMALALLVLGCAAPRAVSPLPRYASAMEEAVGRYEIEARTAPVGRDRFDAILADTLRARGLSPEDYAALAERSPRFYFTQQALYAGRLERAR